MVRTILSIRNHSLERRSVLFVFRWTFRILTGSLNSYLMIMIINAILGCMSQLYTQSYILLSHSICLEKLYIIDVVMSLVLRV